MVECSAGNFKGELQSLTTDSDGHMHIILQWVFGMLYAQGDKECLLILEKTLTN